MNEDSLTQLVTCRLVGMNIQTIYIRKSLSSLGLLAATTFFTCNPKLSSGRPHPTGDPPVTPRRPWATWAWRTGMGRMAGAIRFPRAVAALDTALPRRRPPAPGTDLSRPGLRQCVGGVLRVWVGLFHPGKGPCKSNAIYLVIQCDLNVTDLEFHSIRSFTPRNPTKPREPLRWQRETAR